MRFYKIIGTLFLTPVFAFSQNSTDSLKLQLNLKSSELFQDSISQLILNQAKKNAYFIKSFIAAPFNQAGMYYQLQNGNLITAQDAKQIQNAMFSTVGATKLGKTKLFGGLQYQKIYEDSTSNSHQTRNNPTSPYYFGAPAAVHYERTIYQFKAIAGRNFLKEKIDLGLGLDYKVGSHFSTNDPRGSIQEYQFDLHFNLGYQLTKMLRFGFGYGHGYGTEAVNIGYKNPRYYESSAYPEFYNHLINGYREWEDALKNRNYDNKFQRNSTHFGLDWKHDNLGNWSAFLKIQSEKQNYFLRNNSGFNDLAKYNLNTSELQLNWFQKNNKTRLAASLEWKKMKGKDFNIQFQANNYLYQSDDLKFSFFLSPASNKAKLTYYIQMQYLSEQRNDGISGNILCFKKVWSELGIHWRKSTKFENIWAWNASLAYTTPLSKKLLIPVNIGSFTQNVILHDYRYHQTNVLIPKINISYQIKLFENTPLKLQTDILYYKAINTIRHPYIIENLPLKDRLISKLSLNLYF